MSGQTPPSAGKVALTCPHCGFKQLESPYTKSTFCRKCGEYYEPGKAKPVLRNEHPSLLARVSKFLARNKTREITCFDCGAVQTVSSSSTSSICPQCSAYIDLSDFKINTAFSRMVQTQGTVTIGAKADVTSSKVACREALLEGKLRGNLLCTGTATIKYKGKISGSVEAKHILVAKRSDVEFVRVLKAKSVEIAGKVSANLHIDGIVTITKRGRLDGTVYARGIVVEKGGIFLGELVIGQSTFVQQELIASAHPVPKNSGNGGSKNSNDKKRPDDGQEDLSLGI
ncbi:MAG: polymer-forming cytoskeletal protein [Chthoniobacteraceae bacterium]|nr:polymer-forming cytoskeletal protein [Chthoniobacteraceae bacterium]